MPIPRWHTGILAIALEVLSLISLSLLQPLLLLASLLALGVAHALEPGHGKSLVAAYVSGSREARPWDSVVLGVVVAVIHTLSVLAIGFAGLLLAERMFAQQEELFRSLEVLSGLMILGIGLWVGWHRFFGKNQSSEACCHGGHAHSLPKVGPTVAPSGAEGALASVGAPRGSKLFFRQLLQTRWGALVALGVASGLSPCPMAVAGLMLSLTVGGYGRLAEVVLCLSVFSLGMALTVMVLAGGLMLSRQGILQQRGWFQWLGRAVGRSFGHALTRGIERISALLLIALGCWLTWNAWFTDPLASGQAVSDSHSASGQGPVHASERGGPMLWFLLEKPHE
ncbi:MAG: hypothetical protein SFZ03_08685 [Candidatus Melainabacteria bacterium]|nr:hypothetical protein [Candidatus Melainabacteria bacterium]